MSAPTIPEARGLPVLGSIRVAAHPPTTCGFGGILVVQRVAHEHPAGAACDGRDRKRLERLCRHIARPPLAQERLEQHGDGRLRYRFKRAWRNGTYAVVLEPLDLVARLAALIPPPRFHMLRYHGVLAAHAKARAEVAPGRAVSTPCEPAQLGLCFDAATASEPAGESASTSDRPSRHPWAWLLARVDRHVDETTGITTGDMLGPFGDLDTLVRCSRPGSCEVDEELVANGHRTAPPAAIASTYGSDAPA